MQSYFLEARFDSRASFYNKARVVVTDDGNKELYSYDTKVAYIKDGIPYVLGNYSATTTRHIKEFLLQNNYLANDTKQILLDYSTADFETILQKFLKNIDKSKYLRIETDGDIKDIGSIEFVSILDNKNNVILKFVRDHLTFTVFFDNGEISKNVTIENGYMLRDTLLNIIDIIEENDNILSSELLDCLI